jgi:hypothetical protein
MKICLMIRRIAAILLLVALFLPLSRCSEQRSAEQTDVVQAGAENAAASQTYRYYYAWTDFDVLSPASWLVFVAFLWPLPFLACEIAAKKREARIWWSAAQLLLAGGAITLIYYRTFLNELWVGGYLAYFSLGGYSLALVAEIAAGIARKKNPFLRRNDELF